MANWIKINIFCLQNALVSISIDIPVCASVYVSVSKTFLFA